MKKNKYMRYFKNYVIYEVICGIIAVVGFLIFRFAWGDIWVISRPMMVIGVLGIGVCFLLGITDNGYSEYLSGKLDKMPSAGENETEFISEGYIFDGCKYSRLDKAGRPRSEIFVRTKLFFSKKLRIAVGTVNAETDSADISITELADAAAVVEEREIRVKGNLKKLAVMKLTSSDGTEICFPVKYNDIEVDELAAKINKQYSITG